MGEIVRKRVRFQTYFFPEMKTDWTTHPDNVGHYYSIGCFRCHDGSHTAKDGSTINSDCEFCHKQAEAPATIPHP